MRVEMTPQKINKIVERSFGFAIDYDNLTYAKAQRLSQAIAENLATIKRSHGAHTAERNARYMEMIMVKEGLDRWMTSEQGLFESEMGRSETVLAAKDMVNTVQDMLEKVSKMQNEQMPALLDTIRDQIGEQQAEAFKSAMSPLLANLYQAVSTGREQADSAVRALAGEQVEQPMDMGAGLGSEPAPELPAPEGDSDFDHDEDEFAGTDAAAGGEQELGRGRR